MLAILQPFTIKLGCPRIVVLVKSLTVPVETQLLSLKKHRQLLIDVETLAPSVVESFSPLLRLRYSIIVLCGREVIICSITLTEPLGA